MAERYKILPVVLYLVRDKTATGISRMQQQSQSSQHFAPYADADVKTFDEAFGTDGALCGAYTEFGTAFNGYPQERIQQLQLGV